MEVFIYGFETRVGKRRDTIVSVENNVKKTIKARSVVEGFALCKPRQWIISLSPYTYHSEAMNSLGVVGMKRCKIV